MRYISVAGLAKLAQTKGTEPVIILEIQWADDSQVKRYGDVAISDERVSGTILEVGGLDNVITIQGVSQGISGDSQQISVTLSDIDGTIKNILDSTDVHKQPVWVYQWYKTLDFSDRFLLFKGQVSSPIEWHESDRTVRFDVINQIEDNEYGFSIEEGDFEYVDEQLIGKAWPLCFGTPVNVPALRTRSPYSGVLKTGFGIYDFTLEARLEQLRHVCCPTIYYGTSVDRDGNARFLYKTDPSCFCKKMANITQLEEELAIQKSYSIQIGQVIEIINGSYFPQNKKLWILVCDGAKLYGYFTGDSFKVLDFKHPQKDTLVVPEVRKRQVCELRMLNIFGDEASTGGLSAGSIEGPFTSRDENNNSLNAICGELDDSTDLGWDYLSTFPIADFYWAEPGCEVLLDSSDEIAYICNILPSTILRVASFRTFSASGIRQLVTVPDEYYSTRISNFGGYLVTEVVVDKPLSRLGLGYEDDLYVTLRSSIGPETVEILTWLINRYTSFTIDTTSFNAVQATLSNKYPMDFPLLQRGNILQLLKDIAFQARCALILRNDKFYLIYLSEEPSIDFTINENDVLPGSFVLTHSETEELVTKFVALWKSDHSYNDPNKAIYRYNISRYGTQEQQFDFFAFKYLQLVEKSATFWLIRMANTWRKIVCQTPLTKLQAEVFDCAEVTLNDFADIAVKCFVETATYDSESHEISFQLWTPVRSGERAPYIFAWPADIAVTYIYPTVQDVQQGKAGGTGPNVDVTPPASHPLAEPQGLSMSFKDKTNCGRIAGQISAHTGCRTDHGDSQPSDKDDTAPSDDVPGEGEGVVPTSKNPLGSPSPEMIDVQKELMEKDAQDQNNTFNNNPNAGDGGGGDGDSDPYDDLPDGPPEDCYGAVRLCMDTIGSVFTGTSYSSTPGVCGVPQFGVVNIEQKCSWIYMDSIDGAKQLGLDLKAQGQYGCVGEQGIVSNLTGFINAASSWGPGCEEPDEPAMVGKDAADDPAAWEAAKEALGGL
jgi:hypothetical protein